MEKPQLLLVLPASSELCWRTSNGFSFFYQSVFRSLSNIRSSSGLSPALTALCLPEHPSQQRHGAGDVMNGNRSVDKVPTSLKFITAGNW